MLVVISIIAVAIVIFMSEYGWTDLTGSIRNSLVFETRNQNYGAYEIRQKYGNRLMIAFFGVMGFISIAAITPRFIKFDNNNIVPVTRGGDDRPKNDTTIFENKLKEEEVIEKPKDKTQDNTNVDPPKAPDKSTFNNANPTASNTPQNNDTTKKDENALASNLNHKGTDTTSHGEFKPNGNPNGDPNGTGNGNGNNNNNGNSGGIMAPGEVEVQAELKDYQRYIANALHIPEELYNTDFKGGKVYVTFVVDEFGNVKSPSLKKGVHAMLDPEVVKAVKAMPKWKPAMFNGQPVKVRMVVPVNVILHN